MSLSRLVLSLGALSLFAGLTCAQVDPPTPLVCTTTVASTPALRGESFAEMTGDIVISCTGGTTLAFGSRIPSATISLAYNAPITSRLLPTAGNASTANVSESLLLIDEPGSGLPGYGASLPQILCTTPLAGCTADIGRDSGPTQGHPVANGVAAPNAYQGIVVGSTVTFYGFPLQAPGPRATRTFRLTNIRVNAASLAPSGPATPVQAVITVSGAATAPDNINPTVGLISAGLTAGAGTPGNFVQSVAQVNTPATLLSFAETFGAAFRTRVAAATDTGYAGQINNPVQNVPGVIYASESGLVVPINTTQVSGLADFGTRLKASFSNVPAGVRIFVSRANVAGLTTPAPVPAVIGGSQANINHGNYTGYAILVNGENTVDGDASGFPAVASTGNAGSVPVAEVSLSNGVGTAVWEVVNTDPITAENFKFGVYVTYGANQPSLGTAKANLSYAPNANSGTNLSDSLVPRFVNDAARDIFTIRSAPPTLSVAKSHTGNFTQGQTNVSYTIVVANQTGATPTSGTVTVTDTLPAGLTLVSMTGTGWTCTANSCTRSDSLAGGASYPTITVLVNVAVNATSPLVNAITVSGGGAPTATATDSTNIVSNCSYMLTGNGTGNYASPSGSGSLTIATTSTCGWAATTAASWIHFTSTPAGNGTAQIPYIVDANTSSATRADSIVVANQIFLVSQNGANAGLRFVAIAPCRIADTRFAAAPKLAGGIARDFTVAGACGIPAAAEAYSLNLTVVPTAGVLGFLSVWPAGQSQPGVSTLNSADGRIKANAAIVPAGANGAISSIATHDTHVIIDVNGYFVPSASPGISSLAFYPLPPCRIADTRNAAGALAGPALAGNVSRTFPVLSGSCGIPAGAQAYALNMAVVPSGPLGFLTAWPSGQAQPGSSTLNAPTGGITANAAIVPAGTGGSIDVIATNATDLVIDINGYFAPPGNAGALQFFTTTPCRVADTRNTAGAYGGPMLAPGGQRNFTVSASATCAIPPTAAGFSLNATVVPNITLGFLTLWGPGGQPGVSTLNGGDDTIVANAALIPASATGTISAMASNRTHLILDINGYFAQ